MSARDPRPLAARMRPRTLEEYVGQPHVTGAGASLRSAIERGDTGSLILWGPPGTGKTTLGHLIARASGRAFEPFSAVSEGVPRLREIFDLARGRLASGGPGTVLFVDEIHRLNKSQQDTLLPAVEDGTVMLVGATTENPSFELNAALLSRARVVVLEPLAPADIESLVRARWRTGSADWVRWSSTVDPGVVARLAAESDGDARRALTVLEAAAAQVGVQGRVTIDGAGGGVPASPARHDKAGESHFNMLSAYHKSLRGSDPQGALYWMARMIEAGEDPLVLCRRAIAMAAEDIGLADPQALMHCGGGAGRGAHARRAGGPAAAGGDDGVPGHRAQVEQRRHGADGAALEAARKTPAAAVPLHLRNAPTPLMKDLGYGSAYRYAHDDPVALHSPGVPARCPAGYDVLPAGQA